MSYVRILIGDKSGIIIDELQPEIGAISWRLNNVGQASFKIASADPKATATNLKFGNKMIIQFENGLPDWGGMIYTPRSWDNKVITVAAYSGEYLLSQRITNKGRYFTDQSVGSIFTALINEANDIAYTGVTVGDVYSGGSLYSPDYHYEKILDIFQNRLITRMSTFDFAFLPVLSNGKITFTANLYESRGSSKTGQALIQGKNLADIKLVEQGSIINSWDLAGGGLDWGNDRLTTNAKNLASIDEYGLRQGSQVYSDISEQSVLDSIAANLLAESMNPYNIFTLEALNTEPVGFSGYDVGDRISLLAPDYGFYGTNTTVRILAREYSPQDGRCALVVQEII